MTNMHHTNPSASELSGVPPTIWRHSNASSTSSGSSSRSSAGRSARESGERCLGVISDPKEYSDAAHVGGEDEELDAVTQWLQTRRSSSKKDRQIKGQCDQAQEEEDDSIYANVPLGIQDDRTHQIQCDEEIDPVYGEDTWDSDYDDPWDSSEWDEIEIRSNEWIKKDEKAKHIVKEILLTEQKYVKKLCLMNTLNGQLASLLKSKKEENKNLFPNVEPIYKLHHDHLLPALETVEKEWSSTSSLSTAFSVAPFFNLYIPYITNLNDAKDRLRVLKWKYSDIKDAVADVEESPEFERLQIEMIMLEPFQRLPRYKLLLKRYQSCLEDKDGEQAHIEEVLSEIGKVYDKVQSYLLEQDSFDQLHGIQDRIPGFMIVASGRDFIREGEAMIACENLQKWKQCYLFLFSDMLLITSHRASLGKHKVQSELSLEQVRLEHMPEDRAADRLLLLKRRQHITCLLFKNKDDKDLWEDDLTLNIGRSRGGINLRSIKRNKINNQAKSSSTTSRLFDSAPVWHPDKLSAVCMLCEKKFTTIRRRHHCRGCGILTCGKCSSHTARIPYQDYKKERICDVCFMQAIQHDPSLLRKSERLTIPATCSETVQNDEESGA